MITEKFQYGHSKDGAAIREEVFVKEQGFHDEFDENDAKAWHLVLYRDGEPIATGRVYQIDKDVCQIGRLAVKKAYRGMNIGAFAMKHLMAKAVQLGAKKCIVHSQKDKAGFYSKLGFAPIDNKTFYEEGCPHIAMSKIVLAQHKKYTIINKK